MKAFLVNLLVALSLALCSFNAIQWFREAKLHGRIDALGTEIFHKSTEIQGLQQTVKVNLEEIRRIEGIRENLQTTLKSNRVYTAEVEVERDRFRKDAAFQKAKADQGEQYREAFEKANESIKKQNDTINLQNDKVKALADERNEMVGRFNKLAVDYKTLGEDYQKVYGMYTNLVAQVQAENEKNLKGSKKKSE